MISAFLNISNECSSENYAAPLKKPFCKILLATKSIALAFFSLFKNQRNVTEIPSTHLATEDLLESWVLNGNQTEQENRATAKERIIIALSTNATSLDLSCLQLTTLPPEIGSLTHLQTLDLFQNQLTSLPDSFGNLSHLQTLNLSSNKFTSLPDNVSNLIQIKKLSLFFNKLTSLPNSLGNLTHLQTLDLFHNKLTSLPMTLANIPSLIDINCNNNTIPIAQEQAIFDLCRARRSQEALDSLPTLLNAWKAYSGKKDSYPFTLEELDEDKKRSIHEWLTRLSRAADFKNHQAELAKVVCDLLEGLKDSAFQDLFFASVRANLDACGDRAAMQLNEIFTAYKIHFLPEGAKLKEKLDLLIRGAKTVALRRAISNKIDAWQKDNKKQTLNESVEIYLYYETELKAPLQLLTAISTTSYATGLGPRAWINSDQLKSEVNETYVKDLLGFPSTKTLIEEAPDFRQSWNLTLEDFQERLDEIRSSESLNEQQIYVQSNKLLQEHTLAKENFIKEWLEANI